MAKQTINIPASSTPQTLIIDVPDSLTYSLTGTTPIPIPTPIPPTPIPPTPDPSGYVEVYRNSYDKASDTDPFNHSQGTPTIVTDAIKGNVVRYFVPKGASSISSGWRNETQYNNDLTPSAVDIILEYDMLIKQLPKSRGLMFQVHGEQDGTSGQHSLWLDGGQMYVQFNPTGKKGDPNVYQTKGIQSAKLNVWQHFQWQVRYSNKSDGYIRLLVDGTLYFDSGFRGVCDAQGQYAKTGVNWFSSPESDIEVLYNDFVVKHKK